MVNSCYPERYDGFSGAPQKNQTLNCKHNQTAAAKQPGAMRRHRTTTARKNKEKRKNRILRNETGPADAETHPWQ